MRTYRLRSVPNGRATSGASYINYVFTVPPDIAQVVPDGMEFNVHMDDTGIHFTPVGAAQPQKPAWAQNGHPEVEET